MSSEFEYSFLYIGSDYSFGYKLVEHQDIFNILEGPVTLTTLVLTITHHL